MKKVISAILIFFTIIFISSYVLGATGKVTADTLNIRESASQSAKVIARIAKDQEVEILEDNGDWLKIKYRSYTGYVSSKFISKTETTETKAAEEENQTTEAPVSQENKTEEPKTVVEETKTKNTQYVSNKEAKLKENVKVYSLPTLSSYTVGDISSGTSLLVINSAGQWAYVQTDSLSGWIKLAATDLPDVEVVAEEPEEKPAEPVVENTTSEDNTAENKTEENEAAEPTTETPAESSNSSTDSYPKTMYTNKSSVIIRYSPSKDSGILNSLSKNTKVNVTAKEGEWYKINLRGDTGYIYYTLLSDSTT